MLVWTNLSRDDKHLNFFLSQTNLKHYYKTLDTSMNYSSFSSPPCTKCKICCLSYSLKHCILYRYLEETILEGNWPIPVSPIILLLKVCYYLMVGQVKSSKGILKQLQTSILTITTPDFPKEANFAKEFLDIKIITHLKNYPLYFILFCFKIILYK